MKKILLTAPRPGPTLLCLRDPFEPVPRTICRSQELTSVQMPQQKKLSTEASGCQDYHSDIGQGRPRPRPTGTRRYKVVKGNGKQIL